MRATGERDEWEEGPLEGIYSHLGGDSERAKVGEIANAGTEMRALALRRIERLRTVS